MMFTTDELAWMRAARQKMQAGEHNSRYICDNIGDAYDDLTGYTGDLGQNPDRRRLDDLLAKISDLIDNHFSIEEWLVNTVAQARDWEHQHGRSSWLARVHEYRLLWLAHMIEHG